jgi:pyruvate/2-oxoglutarate dehydrogenase complex dihydrolipoamide dehydrogenase (E3) component
VKQAKSGCVIVSNAERIVPVYISILSTQAGLVTASGAAGVGAKVALIEEHLLGGDCLNVGCVPSKTLIHAANLAHSVRGDTTRLAAAGIRLDPSAVTVDFGMVMERVRAVRAQISHHDSAERYSQELGVEIYIGRAVFASETSVRVNGRTLTFKRAAICTGGYPTLVSNMVGLEELHQQHNALLWSSPPPQQQQQQQMPDQPTQPSVVRTKLTTTASGRDLLVWQPDEPDDQSSSPPPPPHRPMVMTNETIFNMTVAPHHLVVLGAGVIGMELAQAMQRLGIPTTVLGRSGTVLPKEDTDLANLVQQQMIQDGVTFRLNVAEYQKIELTGKYYVNGYPEMKVTLLEKGATAPVEILCDAFLVAAGRRPNVAGLDLELAKVKYNINTGLVVNDRLQTTNPRIYGVGDCCSQYKFTHAADFMARAVIRNALFFGKDKMSHLLIPYATFTSPEIASVGLYAADLQEKGREFRVFEKHFQHNDRAVADDATTGLVRIRVDAKTDEILGASIVGADAGNMISELTLAMQSGTGLSALANVIHPYPTTAEAIRQTGDLYNRTKLTNTVKKVLRGIVQLQR